MEDARRMNVAVTRARRGLILLGHAATLRADRHWGAYLAHLEAEGCVLPASQLCLV